MMVVELREKLAAHPEGRLAPRHLLGRLRQCEADRAKSIDGRVGSRFAPARRLRHEGLHDTRHDLRCLDLSHRGSHPRCAIRRVAALTSGDDALTTQSIETIGALLPPLLRTLDHIAWVQRHLYPPRAVELAETLAPDAKTLADPLQAVEAMTCPEDI